VAEISIQLKKVKNFTVHCTSFLSFCPGASCLLPSCTSH